MQIPNMPNDHKITNNDGTLTDIWASFFSNLITQLSSNLSDEGYILPSQSSANITELNDDSTKQRIIWNSSTEKAMVNNDGTFKDIITT